MKKLLLFLVLCALLFIPSMSSSFEIGGAGGGAPIGAHYLVDLADGSLTAEVVVSANGKAIVTAVDYAAMKLLAGWYTATGDLDTDLQYLAGFTPSANVKSVWNAADNAAIKTLLAYYTATGDLDTDLQYLAGFTPSADVKTILNCAANANIKTALGYYTATGDLHADLQSLAGATAWRMFYSDAATPFIQEIVLGGDGTFLESDGASAAPGFRTLEAGDIPDISATYQPLDADLTAWAGVKIKLDGGAAPTVNDDTDLGYVPGSRWVDLTNDKEYVCLDNTDGAAVWTETTGAGGGSIAVTAEVLKGDGAGNAVAATPGTDFTDLGATIGAAEVDADVATQAELDAVAALVDTDDEIIAIINASPGTQVGVPAGGIGVGTLNDGGLLVGAGTGPVEVLADGLATEILVGGGADTNPAWGTDIPTAVQIGSKYIYRADGTDVPDADVADDITLTNITQITTKPITALSATNWRLFYSGAGAIPIELALGADDRFFVSTGASTAPEFRVLAAGDIPDISATYEGQLTNEAGLYGALSDVANFVQDNEKFTGQVTVQAFGADDATPDVSNAALMVNNVYQTANANPTTITDFDDGDDHSEFADGDWFILRVDDANTIIDFSANANIEGNAGVDFTGSTTQIVYLLFIYEDARWNCVNFTSGFSSPTVLAISAIDMSSGVFAMPNSTNPTTDSVGEISLDESDAGQDPLFVEAYDEGVGDASRIVGTDIHCESFTILEPDLAQAACDDIKLKHFIAEAYPHGATIIAIHVVTDGTDISDTFLFERWDDADGSNQVTVESIALSATDTGEDNGVDAGAITADFFLNLNLDDASDDYKSVTVTIAYRINPGD